MQILRFTFAIMYIVIDVAYVMLTKNMYMSVVRGIQGYETTMDTSRYVAAVAAYGCLALGWFVLVAPRIEAAKQKVLVALAYGVVYGFVVYGVFNFTNYVMFDSYTPMILLQDMVWGTTWVTVVSVFYAIAIQQS